MPENDEKAILCYDLMKRGEDLAGSVKRALGVLRWAMRNYPGKPRVFVLDIDGHRTATKAWDKDAFDYQGILLGEFAKWFTEVQVPLIHIRNPEPQLEEDLDGIEVDGERIETPPTSEPRTPEANPPQGKNTWSRSDDMIVCMSYLESGVTVTDELRASLPHHKESSIYMRLQNFEYLATDGASGLANAAAQTRSIWRLIKQAADKT